MFEWLEGSASLLVHYGLGGLGVAGLLAAAYFSPVFKKDFVYGAIVVAVGMAVYSVGVHDEKLKRDAQQKAVQDGVTNAVKDAITSTKKDPYDDPNLK